MVDTHFKLVSWVHIGESKDCVKNLGIQSKFKDVESNRFWIHDLLTHNQCIPGFPLPATNFFITLCSLYDFKILYIPQMVFVQLRKVSQAFMLLKIQYVVPTFMPCLLYHLTSESIRGFLCFSNHLIQCYFSVPSLLWDSEHFAHLKFDYVQWMMGDKQEIWLRVTMICDVICAPGIAIFELRFFY